MEHASNNLADLKSDKLDNDGFTIVELVVSVLILAITSMFMAPLLVQSLNTSAKNELRINAIELNRERLEELQNGTYTCASLENLVNAQPEFITMSSGDVFAVDYSSESTAACPGAAPFSYQVNVAIYLQPLNEKLSNASTNLLVLSDN